MPQTNVPHRLSWADIGIIGLSLACFTGLVIMDLLFFFGTIIRP